LIDRKRRQVELFVKVGIYNEPSGGGIGGSEITVAVLAESLAGRHQVEIVHHKPGMSLQRLAEISGAELSAVRMRYVALEPYPFGSAQTPWQRYREARNWQAALSEPYDLFINFTHGFPPFCHAKRGALVVLFPFHERPSSEIPSDDNALLRNRIKTVYHEWEWQKRLSTYQIKVANSRFSQIWTKRRWDIDCEIIYPPVDTHIQPGDKKNAILSVGRFTATGHTKKQLEMMTTFDELRNSRLRDWNYFCVGGLGDTSADRAYFQAVSRKALDCRAQVLANIERSRLKELYGQASIFWHAAGYGEGDERPELSEHFGIATVEAMSAGCVPIVINKGGQPEIVEHGVSGFLWGKLEELKEYTELASKDEQLRAQMAEAARARAALFSREAFVSRFLSLIGEAD